MILQAFLEGAREPRVEAERGGWDGEGGLPIEGGLQVVLEGWDGQPLTPVVVLSRALALSPAWKTPSEV